MSVATELQTEYNSFINKYGGSILHWEVRSGTPTAWGDVNTGSKFVTSTYFIGMIQEARKVLNYQEFGQVAERDCICFTKSGVTLSLGDKIEYNDKEYEISNVHPKSVSDITIYNRILLTDKEL